MSGNFSAIKTLAFPCHGPTETRVAVECLKTGILLFALILGVIGQLKFLEHSKKRISINLIGRDIQMFITRE